MHSIPLSALVKVPTGNEPVMTAEQKKFVAEHFAEALTIHRAAMIAHLNTVGKPAPTASELVMALVERIPISIDKPDEFRIAAYEIVDDHPVPPAIQALRDSLNGN